MDLQEKIRLRMQGKTGLRNAVRLFVSFISGIIGGISQSWSVFFVLILIYCLLEMIMIFGIFRSRYVREHRFENPDIDYSPNHNNAFTKESITYALSLSAYKCIRSFILISVLGIIVKILVGFLVSI